MCIRDRPTAIRSEHVWPGEGRAGTCLRPTHIRSEPSWMQNKWRGQVQRIRETGACPTLQDMVVFLERQALAQNDPVFGVRAVATEPAQASRVQQPTSRRREPVCTVAAEPDSSCPVCGAAHALAACPDFRKENHQQRWNTIRKERLCFACLLPGHRWTDCAQEKPCKEKGCSGKHHTLLHKPRRDNKPSGKTQESRWQGKKQTSSTQPQPESEPSPQPVGFVSSGRTALPLVPVRV